MLIVSPIVSLSTSEIPLKSIKHKIPLAVSYQSAEGKSRVVTSIVHCEAIFGDIDGKTAQLVGLTGDGKHHFPKNAG